MIREYPKRPWVGVGVVVWRAGDVLMVKRGKPPRLGSWSLPGGAQRLGETAAEAALREVAEETGLEVDILGLIDVVDSIQRDGAGAIRYHYTLIDFAAQWRAGTPVAGDDAAEAKFFAAADLKELDLWSETRRIIAASESLKR